MKRACQEHGPTPQPRWPGPHPLPTSDATRLARTRRPAPWQRALSRPTAIHPHVGGPVTTCVRARLAAGRRAARVLGPTRSPDSQIPTVPAIKDSVQLRSQARPPAFMTPLLKFSNAQSTMNPRGAGVSALGRPRLVPGPCSPLGPTPSRSANGN